MGVAGRVARGGVVMADRIMTPERWFDVRVLDDEPGSFDGYASTFDEMDSHGTVFDKGAFRKTIREHKGKLPVTMMHRIELPIGLASIKEDNKGLWVDGQLDLDVQKGAEVYSGMKKGYITQMSHTFRAVKELIIEEDGKKIPHFKEVRLFEIAAVTTNFASNEEALILGVRTETEDRAVISSNLPLASKDRSWDAGAARKRVKAWAGDDMGKYRKAFLWVGDDPENVTSYKFPIADVIDDSLKAIPRAIYAAAGRINQAKGVDVDGVKAQLAKYYKKLGETPPWKRVIVTAGMGFQVGRLDALLREPPGGTLTGEPPRKPGNHLQGVQRELKRLERVTRGD